MNSWRDHLKFGLYFEVIFILIMFFWQEWFYASGVFKVLILVFEIFIISVLSPLFLDLDHKLGKLREVFTFLGLSISMVGVTGYYFGIDLTILMVFGVIISTISYMLCYTTHHRGYTHTIVFCVFYGVLTYFIFNRIDLGVLALIGSYSHLVADKIPFRFITLQKGIV